MENSNCDWDQFKVQKSESIMYSGPNEVVVCLLAKSGNERMRMGYRGFHIYIKGVSILEYRVLLRDLECNVFSERLPSFAFVTRRIFPTVTRA